jgi:carbon-monoxide dehydrogenase small subunit
VRLLHAGVHRRDGRALRDNPEPSDAEIREALSGNICRCTGYGKILEAVHRSASRGYAQ